MKASIAGRVSHTNLPKAKALLPVFEAVVNAFQAIEEPDAGPGPHEIQIVAERQGNLDDGKPGPIESFVVTDTGVGFTDANYDSFNTVDSLYKAPRGGKGLGRFLWLKAFDRVEIDSHYRVSGGGMLRRTFTFVASDEDRPCKIVPSNRSTPLTTVRLIACRPPYRGECPRSLEIIAQRMIGHFLPFFLDPFGPTLMLSDAFQQIDLRAYYRDNFEAIASRRAFVVAGQSFTLNGFRLQSSIVDHHELVYGANYREVMSERLSRFLRSLRNKLHDAVQGQFVYLGFIQSPFLDAKVNSERTDFSIPKEPPTERIEVGNESSIAIRDLLADEIDLKSIREAALMAVKEDLKPYLDELNTTKEAALKSYIAEEAPQYRVLLRHQSEFIDQIPPDASKDEMEMALHRHLYERQVELKKEGRRILEEVDTAPDSDDFYRRFDQYVSDANEIGKTALAQYVVHRRVIVELLDKALSRDSETGRYGLEKTVHSLVFPMRTTSDDVPLEQQNLWIIDERLTFHSFLSSDKPLNALATVDSDSESRPDILIFNRALAFSEDSQPLTSLVVIEFKQPMRKAYTDEDPVTQVYRMVRDIRSGQFKDSKGQLIRTLTENVPAYCYIICDLTVVLETRLQDMSALRTPDNLGYYGYNPTLNAYYEIISYTKLLRDAKKRNRILFDKLNLPVIQ
jgi:hypothetical protein